MILGLLHTLGWMGLVLLAAGCLGGIWLAVDYLLDGLRDEPPAAAGPKSNRSKVA